MITQADFLGELALAVPESADVVRDHLEDNDELLLHLLMSDLLRMTVRRFDDGEMDVVDRLLQFIDFCLRTGDESVSNAVAVSFAEDFGAFAGESDGLLARWPMALRKELRR